MTISPDHKIAPHPTATVGVTRTLSTVKRDLLLFDHLRIIGLNHILNGKADSPDGQVVSESVVADFDFLVEEKAVSNAPANAWEVMDEIEERGLARNPDWYAWRSGRDEDIARSRQFPNDEEAGRLASKIRHPSGRPQGDDPAEPGLELIVAYADSLFSGDETVAIVDREFSEAEIESMLFAFVPEDHRVGKLVDLAEVFINKVPFPGDEIPLSEILAFARDGETRNRIRSLRLWMAKAALSSEPIKSLAVEIETMIHEFGLYMDAFDSRQRTGLLQLTIGIPSDLAGIFAGRPPTQTSGALLGLKKRKADRLMAEIAAPGHELAYLRSAHERFS
jgi:hypothetical protein